MIQGMMITMNCRYASLFLSFSLSLFLSFSLSLSLSPLANDLCVGFVAISSYCTQYTFKLKIVLLLLIDIDIIEFGCKIILSSFRVMSNLFYNVHKHVSSKTAVVAVLSTSPRPAQGMSNHCTWPRGAVQRFNNVTLISKMLFAWGIGGARNSVSCFSSSSTGASPEVDKPTPFKLIVYSKDDCPLCDKLKEKLNVLKDRADFIPTSVLHDAVIEVRDIATRPDWLARYEMEVPVMAVADLDGENEKCLPRASPRGNADALEKHLNKYLRPNC